MPRKELDPKLRRIVMQGLLVATLAGALGLAWLVTRQVRQMMRLELADTVVVGRLMVRLPVKWTSGTVSIEHGDAVEAEEPAGELPGRRLKILRQRSDGLINPLEHLHRSGRIKPDTLRALVDAREGYTRQNLLVGGWPGQMYSFSRTVRPGVTHKDVIAAAITGGSQALVIHLEGVGPLDASDRELVKQMAETVGISMQGGPIDPGADIELVDEIHLKPAPHYLAVPNDDANQLQRQLIFDGAGENGWVAIDLVSCIHFQDEGENGLAVMLEARDPEWRGGVVRRLSSRVWVCDRAENPARPFPARAYLCANTDGRALLLVMRGGPRDSRLFDAAWDAMAPSIRFENSRNLVSLLANGAEAVAELRQRGIEGLFEATDAQDWMIWDQSENADKEGWLQSRWQTNWPDDGPVGQMSGKRVSLPVDPYATDVRYEQEWSATTDLQNYSSTTHRDVPRGGNQFPRRSMEQRLVLEKGRIVISSAAGDTRPADAPVPEAFVPGALLPLVLRELAERPCLLKTESFIGTQTLAPRGLLTLFVTRLADAPLRRDEKGGTMECVSVSVNGTGAVTRWYYSSDGILRFVDFAAGVKGARRH